MRTENDRAFFSARVELLSDRLYGTALRLARDRTVAEDLVSEAIVKAWSKLDQLADRSCFEKWILRILTNTFLSSCRRTREVPLDTGGEEDEGDDDSFSLFEQAHQPFLLWWGNPEQQLLTKLLRKDLDAALERLPACYREVVILVELLGYSYAETADALEVPIGTVRSRLKRGRSALQHALWQQACDAGLVDETRSETHHHG